jgi:hypothetical protein
MNEVSRGSRREPLAVRIEVTSSPGTGEFVGRLSFTPGLTIPKAKRATKAHDGCGLAGNAPQRPECRQTTLP